MPEKKKSTRTYTLRLDIHLMARPFKDGDKINSQTGQTSVLNQNMSYFSSFRTNLDPRSSDLQSSGLLVFI